MEGVLFNVMVLWILMIEVSRYCAFTGFKLQFHSPLRALHGMMSPVDSTDKITLILAILMKMQLGLSKAQDPCLKKVEKQ